MSKSAKVVLAQDIHGLEACTAEKQRERRTGACRAMSNSCSGRSARSTRETNEKLAAAVRDLAAATAEIAVLQLALAKLDGELAQLRANATPDTKK